MQITKDAVKAAVKASRKFPRANFGLRVGEDWPDFVTEALKSDTVRAMLLADFGLAQHVLVRLAERMASAKTEPEVLATLDPATAEVFLQWMYIGVELGKQMAEAEKLEAMFKAE